MGNISFCFLFLVIKVSMYLSQQPPFPDPESDPIPDIYKIEELDEYKEVHSRFDLFGDGKKKKLPALEQICYEAHIKCTPVFKNGSVCGHHKKYGLIIFPNICELRFQNCLMKAYVERTGDKSKALPFYYNGKGEPCNYYIDNVLSIDDAVQKYFTEDLDYKIKQYEEYVAAMADEMN